MAQDTDLGDLIMRLNPYTNNSGQHSGQPTGNMDIYMLNPVPTSGGASNGSISQIQMEVDSAYSGDWTFKGQPQRINKSARILYRFPVLSSTGTVLYWIEDYLLIGFEGTGAG